MRKVLVVSTIILVLMLAAAVRDHQTVGTDAAVGKAMNAASVLKAPTWSPGPDYPAY